MRMEFGNACHQKTNIDANINDWKMEENKNIRNGKKKSWTCDARQCVIWGARVYALRNERVRV